MILCVQRKTGEGNEGKTGEGKQRRGKKRTKQRLLWLLGGFNLPLGKALA